MAKRVCLKMTTLICEILRLGGQIPGKVFRNQPVSPSPRNQGSMRAVMSFTSYDQIAEEKWRFRIRKPNQNVWRACENDSDLSGVRPNVIAVHKIGQEGGAKIIAGIGQVSGAGQQSNIEAIFNRMPLEIRCIVAARN
jgi:hypothetical protein